MFPMSINTSEINPCIPRMGYATGFLPRIIDFETKLSVEFRSIYVFCKISTNDFSLGRVEATGMMQTDGILI